jgi:transcriptional regulator with XRE-family HTH domain
MGIKHVKEARNLAKPEHFRMVREALELTQADLAKLLGYGSKSRIAELEAGTRKPGAAVVRLLRAYLDGYRPLDWPRKPVRVAKPRSLRIVVRETEPIVHNVTLVTRLPATPENIEKVRSAMRNGLRQPGEIARATGLGLLSVEEAMDAIAKLPPPPPKPPVPLSELRGRRKPVPPEPKGGSA